METDLRHNVSKTGGTLLVCAMLLAGACSSTPTISPADAGAVDASHPDAGRIDAGATDAGHIDAGSSDDAGPIDAGSIDAGIADAGDVVDAGSYDAGSADEVDAGDPDGGYDPRVLAPPGSPLPNVMVDGIDCGSHEAFVSHVHAHLAIYVNGEEKLVPAGVGIGVPRDYSNGFVVGGSCFSWLHTHDVDGIIHIEAPLVRDFTLGNFFDIWRQPLSATQAGPAEGTVTAYVNGVLFTDDLTTIKLNSHDVIQLDVGEPVIPPQPYTFQGGL